MLRFTFVLELRPTRLLSCQVAINNGPVSQVIGDRPVHLLQPERGEVFHNRLRALALPVRVHERVKGHACPDDAPAPFRRLTDVIDSLSHDVLSLRAGVGRCRYLTASQLEGKPDKRLVDDGRSEKERTRIRSHPGSARVLLARASIPKGATAAWRCPTR